LSGFYPFLYSLIHPISEIFFTPHLIMNSKKECIVVLLSTFMVMKYVIVGILALQKLAISEHNVHMMLMAVYIAE